MDIRILHLYQAKVWYAYSSPSQELDDGIIFPCHSHRVEFTHANVIVEVLWQTTQFEHGTTYPPPSLSTNDLFTHFGCSFQVNKKLGAVSKRLKDLSDDLILTKTLCKSQKYYEFVFSSCLP